MQGMKNPEKREVRSHNKVRALFAENKVRFARAEQLWNLESLGLSFFSLGTICLQPILHDTRSLRKGNKLSWLKQDNPVIFKYFSTKHGGQVCIFLF